ncbi:MAG: 16S rRNA (cytidine(1402)-2'-O)-methyltransferase [Nitrospira sp.]|nr:16S rRNA (cytidine(1402)-2'-O)-methyltransferase [Nitrospira sp.]
MPGTLYLVSTPIGNLEDLTFRGHRILQEVSVIAAEDTRHTQKLCRHYQIPTPLTSYHDFNKEEKTPVLLKLLKEEQSIALVSDAGTPLISDPGYYLVTRAIAVDVPVVPVPGPSSVIAALSVAGLPTDAFTFIGFLPKKSAARTRLLESLQEDSKTIILFETPHRIQATLLTIKEILGDRQIAIGRELTKTHEEVIRGTAREILLANPSRVFKGEMTLVIQGKPKRTKTGTQTGIQSSPF